MGVDDVRLFPPDHVPQNGPGAEHVSHAAPVHGGVIVPDACGGDLRDIDAAVGHNDNLVPLVDQLLGQLHNVGLRPADVQAHGGHKDFHWRPLLFALLNSKN